MHIQTLNPSKYKRLFTFGCSFTRYLWPTWADILAEDIPYYENWGRRGAGNHYIFNAIMEAHNRHTFTKDDLIVVMWSLQDREDRYASKDWIVSPGAMLEETYGKEWVKKFSDRRGSIVRDLAIIQSIQLFLDTLDSDWINMSLNTFANGDEEKVKKYSPIYLTEIYEWNTVVLGLHKGEVSNLLQNLDVIECYKNVFLKLMPPVYNTIMDSKEYNLKTRPNDGDGHPTPLEILNYLDLIFPDNTISNNAREYAKYWDKIVWDTKYIKNNIFETRSRPVNRL